MEGFNPQISIGYATEGKWTIRGNTQVPDILRGAEEWELSIGEI